MAEVFAPYQELHEQTYHKCLELKDSPVWKKSKEESGATFYTASAEGSSFSMVKSETLIKAPMQAVIDRLANTPKIDENTPDAERDGTRERWLAKTVDDETRATFLYIALISSSRFVTDRDFLMYRRCYKNGEMHVQLSVSVVNDEIKPEVKGRVRAHMFFQCFFVEQVDPEHVKLTFICHADPKGSVPGVVYNMQAVGQGASVIKIRKQLENEK